MNEINEALKQLLLKVISTISSTKFWFTVLGMAFSGYLAYQVGGINAVIIAVAGIIGLPIVYTVSKTKQNIGLANAETERLRMGVTEFKPIKPKSVEGLWTIDLVEFARNVKNTVVAAYTVDNPATFYLNAERLGWAVDAGTWENAQIYWDFIASLAEEAYVFVHGEDMEACEKKISENKGRECTGWDLASHARTAGFEHYVALLRLQRAVDNSLNTQELSGKCDYSLYLAGEMAKYL